MSTIAPLKPRSAPLGKTGNVIKFQFGAIVKDHFSGKGTADLAACYYMKHGAPAVEPLLKGIKHHFQAVIVAGKVPQRKPVRRRYVKSNLIEFVQPPIHKKRIFGTGRGIRRNVSNTESNKPVLVQTT